MVKHDDLVNRLIMSYSEISKTVVPEWAVRQRNCPEMLVMPTIPFVGKHYAEQKQKILVYASAESLVDYYPNSENTRPWLDDSKQAINRHRLLFDSPDNNGRFFPNVHIQPMNDGTLATACFYIAISSLSGYENKNMSPKDFYENIAIANYSKYSMATERQMNIYSGRGNYGSDINIDPTRMSSKEAKKCLSASHPYLEKDIEILEPDVVILPEGLDNIDNQYLQSLSSERNIKFIGIYQLGPIPINCTISRKYPAKNIAAFPGLNEWVLNIQRISNEKYLHVFSYLDNVLENLET